MWYFGPFWGDGSWSNNYSTHNFFFNQQFFDRPKKYFWGKLKKFQNIKITWNEWETAKKFKGNYHLYVVTDCKSETPRYEIIKNPVKYIFESKE